MTTGRARLLVCALVGILATPAHAQSVEAETLFREGKKLLNEGKLEAACDKLEASDRIEASAGTELNLAACREKNGQLATAWAVFRKAASAAKAANDVKRGSEARRRAAAIEPRLAQLTIVVPDASRFDGLQIARNGATVDDAVWNVAVPVDAGQYEITAQAPGHERWSRVIAIARDGEKATVELPKLEPIKEAAPPPPVVQRVDKPVVTPQPEPEPKPESHRVASHTFTATRDVAVVIGIVGIAAIAGGAVLGSKATSWETQSNSICPTATCNDPHALALNSDAKTDALRANIGFIAGGAAVAGAIVLWFVGAPSDTTDHLALVPSATRGGADIALVGRF